MTELAAAVVAHADWSIRPAKRVICIAKDRHLHLPQRLDAGVGELDELVDHLLKLERPVLFGVDLPLGFPATYAQRARMSSFRQGLATAYTWPAFFEVADNVEQISLQRPFYPARGGRVKMDDLVEALGLSRRSDLRRHCDFEPERGKVHGAPLFWTMGANQVGKAALSFWREVLPQALDDPRVALWPFDGHLDELLASHALVIAEAFPTIYHRPLGLDMSSRSKLKADDRRALAPKLLEACARLELTVTEPLLEAIADGFDGGRAGGDDHLDALIGCLGLCDALTRPVPELPQRHERLRQIEGWILGMALPDALTTS